MQKDTIKNLSLSELTSEQQELINLIKSEVSDLLELQAELFSDLDKRVMSDNQLAEILDLQIFHANRIGSAAEMIGLCGLQYFCLSIRKNLQHIRESQLKDFISLRSKILYWPDIIHAYLLSPYNLECIQAALDYLDQDYWPVDLEKHELDKLESLFLISKIEIDRGDLAERISKATPELVSLKISEEINSDLLNSLMLDLPRQTEELSRAAQNLQNDNFLKQLEIAGRITHTLKGAGNTVGIQGIVSLTHHLEDIFAALLKAKAKPSESLQNAIQNATDCLEEMSEYLEDLGPIPEQSELILQEILDWANKIDNSGIIQPCEQKENKIASRSPDIATQAQTAQKKDLNVRHTDTTADPFLRIPVSLADDLLKRAGENIIANEQIKELVFNLQSSIQHLSSSNKKIKMLSQELDNLIGIRGFSFSRQNISKDSEFDSLEMEQFNELHTLTNQLMESSDDSVEYSSEIEEALFKLERLSLSQLRNLHENQTAVSRIRMIPVRSIVPRLRRALRQACKQSGKHVNLEISGEDTLIDSEFIHQLVDPLMHIIRNAVDHGIEAPEQRLKCKKSSEGRVQLSFKKEGGLIHVVCQDDGRGLDLDLIKSKAIAKEYLQADEKLSNDRAIQIILEHGFSTKDKVSQLSGRGVGLAAVHTKVLEMKGSVAIDTNKDNGVRVEVIIPTTINSVHALIVRCADITVALSNRGVDEILYAGAGEFVSDSGQMYFEYMQHRYPVFDLQYLLAKTADNLFEQQKVTLLINDDQNKKIAVTIDEIFDTRDIVTKPLSKFIPNILGLLGSTILGDGSVTTVIDIVELLKNSNMSDRTFIESKKLEKSQDSLPFALIVEDSISTRKSLEQFMKDLGFAVNTAKDGVEAINQILLHTPSIVLTDLEMPRMNGLELSNHLRSNEKTASIPIIMITSKSSDKHVKEAERIGVSAYITKPYDDEELLECMNSLGVAAFV